VFYTPSVTNTPRTVEHDVDEVWAAVTGLAVRETWDGDASAAEERPLPDLVVVDEADRLKTASLNSYFNRPSCAGWDKHGHALVDIAELADVDRNFVWIQNVDVLQTVVQTMQRR
jgi:hypothetical protein